MFTPIDLALRAVLIGAGATLLIDAWAALLARVGVPSLRMHLLGRWVGHLAQGRVAHASIATAAPVRGEAWLGWLAHYAIGITFAALLLLIAGPSWARTPTLWPALALGVGTVVAPLFILQPGMGAGIASSKTPRPLFNAMKSVVTHTMFGVGLFLAGRAVAVWWPVGE